MRVVSVAVIGVLSLLLTSCGSSKPKDLIVGKWQADDDADYTIEFTADGKYKSGKLNPRVYKLTDDKTIEFSNDDGSNKSTYTVSVTKSELTLTSGDNRVEKFKRAN